MPRQSLPDERRQQFEKSSQQRDGRFSCTLQFLPSQTFANGAEELVIVCASCFFVAGECPLRQFEASAQERVATHVSQHGGQNAQQGLAHADCG
jgi:hypothetical protein